MSSGNVLLTVPAQIAFLIQTTFLRLILCGTTSGECGDWSIPCSAGKHRSAGKFKTVIVSAIPLGNFLTYVAFCFVAGIRTSCYLQAATAVSRNRFVALVPATWLTLTVSAPATFRFHAVQTFLILLFTAYVLEGHHAYDTDKTKAHRKLNLEDVGCHTLVSWHCGAHLLASREDLLAWDKVLFATLFAEAACEGFPLTPFTQPDQLTGGGRPVEAIILPLRTPVGRDCDHWRF